MTKEVVWLLQDKDGEEIFGVSKNYLEAVAIKHTIKNKYGIECSITSLPVLDMNDDFG